MFFYDAYAVIELGEKLFDYDFSVVSDTLNTIQSWAIGEGAAAHNTELRKKSLKAAAILHKLSGKYKVYYYDEVPEKLASLSLEDCVPIAAAWKAKHSVDLDIVYITHNVGVELVAQDIYKLPVYDVYELPFMKPKEYKGWRTLKMSDGGSEFLSEYYSGSPTKLEDSKMNEYLEVTNDDGSEACIFRFDGDKYVGVNYSPINSRFMGKVRPLNPQQEMAFDLLQNDSITIKLMLGVYGGGKDFLMVSHAINMIEHGKYEKLVWVRNNIEVKDSKPLGALPGDLNAKVLPFAGPLMDHIGGEDGLYKWMNDGKIELQHLGYIRGRDIKNSIIICSEAENLTKEHIQLLIGRVGEHSALWLNGDNRQIDGRVFENNNGITFAIDRLVGQPEFGYVYLPTTERSRTASLADLLD